MNARAWLVGAAAGMVGLCCGGGAVAFAVTGWMAGSVADVVTAQAACTSGGASFVPVAAPNGGGVDGYDKPDQVANVATIVGVGRQMRVPTRGWVIAVATAMQESALRNSSNATDHDSVGLFQQRPSQGWGTVAQIMDPAYASREFFDHLTAIPGWQSLPLTVAAQKVQRSAFPGAYAKHEGGAAKLVDRAAGGVADTGTAADGCAHAGETTASGWTAPVKGASIGSRFGEDRGDHKHAGVDLMVPKRTPIVAVADGTVIKAVCDANINCDRDGSGSTPGCGWYVDIRHAGGIISRYCHQVQRPLVVAGQHVTVGQQIGWSGTSGHSSGPHVHFEIHHNDDEHAASGAIDPIAFMQSKGVNLGDKHV